MPIEVTADEKILSESLREARLLAISTYSGHQ